MNNDLGNNKTKIIAIYKDKNMIPTKYVHCIRNNSDDKMVDKGANCHANYD